MELALGVLTGPSKRMITTPKMAYSIGCIECEGFAGFECYTAGIHKKASGVCSRERMAPLGLSAREVDSIIAMGSLNDRHASSNFKSMHWSLLLMMTYLTILDFDVAEPPAGFVFLDINLHTRTHCRVDIALYVLIHCIYILSLF